MEPQEILQNTRSLIREHSKNDADKWFYANRYVFARLHLDERKTKIEIKKDLLSIKNPCCFYCGKQFDSKKGVHLHRLDENRGYSKDNCVLIHPDCHQKYHLENPQSNRKKGRPKTTFIQNPDAILVKESRKYEGAKFIYWWDISPSLAEDLSSYDVVEFVKKRHRRKLHDSNGSIEGVPDQRATNFPRKWQLRY